MSDESTGKVKKLFVGPPQTNWYKYQVGRFGMFLSNNIPYFSKVPIGNRVFNWSFKVTVLSRDFETMNESSPQNQQGQE
jgi:hypothetical protein